MSRCTVPLVKNPCFTTSQAFSPPSKIISPTKEKETSKAKDSTPVKPKEVVSSKPSDLNKTKKSKLPDGWKS